MAHNNRGKSKSGNRKHGRDRDKCRRYRESGRREKNKARRKEKLNRKLAKRRARGVSPAWGTSVEPVHVSGGRLASVRGSTPRFPILHLSGKTKSCAVGGVNAHRHHRSA